MSYAEIETQIGPSTFWVMTRVDGQRQRMLLGVVARFDEAKAMAKENRLRLQVSAAVREQMEAAGVAPLEWPAGLRFGRPVNA